MDLESESSLIESVEDNEVIAPENLRNVSENGNEKALVGTNGDCSFEHVGNTSLGDVKFDRSESSVSGSTPQVKKGAGLKRWRRIQRESGKERGKSVEDGVVGKRGFPNATPDSRNNVLSAETKQRSEGSVSSTNAVAKSSGFFGDGFDPIFAAAATDSENSEDRSSKSSTAASAPVRRSEIPAVGGYMGHNNGITSKSGNHISADQRSQQGRSRSGSGKKARGEQVKIEKENSHYSMESDSQGSNFVFMQGADSVTSKGRQSRRPGNYDGDNSDDEAQGSAQHFAEELQAGFRKNMAEFEDVSQIYNPTDLNWEIKGDTSVINNLSADQDPLLESITTLQSAQEALAQELQKFREIGKDDSFLFSDAAQDSSPNLSEQQHYGETGQTLSSSSETESEIVNLKQYVNELQSKLDEARLMLTLKEGKVTEVSTSLISYATQHHENSEIMEVERIVELEQKNLSELDIELEGLFRQKVEAIVEYVVISRTIQDSRVAAVDKITFLEEQNAVAASAQAQVKIVGNKASMLKRQVDMLETETETREYVKLKRRMCNYASHFFIQLILVFVAVCFYVLQLVPQHTEDVPT